MGHQPLVPRELERIARRVLTGCPHGTYDELMERLEAMRDLRHRAGHFETIARRALELLESGEWEEPKGPLRPRTARRMVKIQGVSGAGP